MAADRLNVGCGNRFHPDWTNLDLVSSSPHVIACDLQKGIPFPEGSFDIVYHSHVLEHIPRPAVNLFLGECARVLRKSGIIRIAVPDLEVIARLYLEKLERAIAGSDQEKANYRWMMLELFDQVARTQPGGEALVYLAESKIINEAFVMSRWGFEAKKNIEHARNQGTALPQPRASGIITLVRALYRLARYPAARHALAHSCRDAFLRRILGSEWPLLELGRFRTGGSIHQWMYDRFSLSQLLQTHGFKNIVQRSATESYVAGWSEFNLDSEPDGTVYKPDSLFIEGVKE